MQKGGGAGGGKGEMSGREEQKALRETEVISAPYRLI